MFRNWCSRNTAKHSANRSNTHKKTDGTQSALNTKLIANESGIWIPAKLNDAFNLSFIPKLLKVSRFRSAFNSSNNHTIAFSSPVLCETLTTMQFSEHGTQSLFIPFQALRSECAPVQYPTQQNTIQRIPSISSPIHFSSLSTFCVRRSCIEQQQRQQQQQKYKKEFFVRICLSRPSCYRLSWCIKHFSIFAFLNKRLWW